MSKKNPVQVLLQYLLYSVINYSIYQLSQQIAQLAYNFTDTNLQLPLFILLRSVLLLLFFLLLCRI